MHHGSKEKGNNTVSFVDVIFKKTWKREEEAWEDMYSYLQSDGSKVVNAEDDEQDEIGVIAAISHAAEVVVQGGRRQDHPRKPNVDRTQQKEVWSNGYRVWDDDQFKSRVRINRESFEFILAEIGKSIAYKIAPTNLQPDPIEPHRQLGLTLYRFAHGCTYQVLQDVFGERFETMTARKS